MPAYDPTIRQLNVNGSVNKKRCRECQAFKSPAEFYFHPSNSDRLSALCCVCQSADSKQRYRNNPTVFKERSKARRITFRNDARFKLSILLEKKRQLWYNENVPCDLTLDYLHGLYIAQEGKCVLTGLEMFIGEGDGNLAKAEALSIDRVKSELGYTIGNVRLVIHQVNMARSRFDDVQLLDLCTAVVKCFHANPDGWGEVKLEAQLNIGALL
jgi:hypothetical protein